MDTERGKNSVAMWVVLVALVSQTVVMPVMCRSLEGVGDQKNYYHTPKRSHHKSPSCKTPSPSSGGSHGTPHSSPAITPPSHTYNPITPSITPPTPTYDPITPSITPPTPTYNPITPPSPTYDPITPSITPPIPTYNPITPPSPTYDPITPSITPPTPTYNPITPPSPTYDPITPPGPTYNPVPDPNVPPSYPVTCKYWGTHPQLIWGLFGFWGTMAGIFGAACTPVYGHNLSLQQALTNTRNDGIGALYREGTASLLNSMMTNNFPYTTQDVKYQFTAALVSDEAAAAQAQLFKQANEGQLKR